MGDVWPAPETAANALADWQSRIGRRRVDQVNEAQILPAPAGLTVTAGRGQITLDWQLVDGAIGYQVLRADSVDGPYHRLDHHGGDVLAVPHPPYADTTAEPERRYHYSVAALADIDQLGPMTKPVAAACAHGGDAAIRVHVDTAATARPLDRPWQPMIGAEHLSHALSTETTGGQPIGAELTAALRIARDELGVRSVRAHAILCDDLGVYREVDGEPVYHFDQVDAVYDHILAVGLRPVVELSFMPHDLARDPSKTVFEYSAIVSPPKDWDRWVHLIRAFVSHLIDRYGLAEVSQWPFEVWNEANLEVFWSGTRAEFMRLYDLTATTVKQVHPSLRVGGPASAAAGWVGELLAHVGESGAPIDFVATHTYGSPPLDFRPLCARYGHSGLPLLWTEWGVTPTHFASVNDSVFAAAFLLHGMRSAAGRIDALAYWVVSDHFEELGRPPRLLHGGFGLLTVGNLRKPRFWALAMLNRLGEHELPVRIEGDGARSLVQAWATADDNGAITMIIFNTTLDQSKVAGCPLLTRDTVIELRGLPAVAYQVRHWRVDATHSNIGAVWQQLAGGDWPTPEQWTTLRAHDKLDVYEPARQAAVTDGVLRTGFSLPMPSISHLSFTPVGQSSSDT